MGRHEETIQEAFIWAIPFWKRFIDDIFLIFLDTNSQLQPLQNFMNHLHPKIKLTFQHPTQQIFFLDMTILIRVDHKLSTTLYRKPTDCATLLHFHSDHSLKCKESIVFSQALRYNLVIAETTYYKKNLTPSQYLALPENTHWTSSPTTSPRTSSSPVTPFSMKPPRHQVPWQSSQLSPHIP